MSTTVLASTGSLPAAVEQEDAKVGAASTPTVASNTDAPAPETAAPAEASKLGQNKNTTANPRVTATASSGTADLKGSVALSVVASSHSSLTEALKRLRLEFETIRASGVACDKALSTIDSLLTESESLLSDLISRSSETGNDTSRKRRANAKRSNRKGSARKEQGKNAPEDAINATAGTPKEPQALMGVAGSPRRGGAAPGASRNNKRVPLSGIFGNDRATRGPPMYIQASPNQHMFRIDESVMQYRSPQYYSLISESRFPAAGIAAGPAMPRKARPGSGVRERERDAGKNKVLAREKEEAALRNELRSATTIQQFTDLVEKANKLGMQFEVAAVNSRLAKLQAAQVNAPPAPTAHST